MVRKIVLPEVLIKYLKVAGYLLASGILAWLSATYIAKNENLSVLFAPLINFLLVILVKEINKEGVIEALREKK
jgi:hypothetical protein